MTALVRPPLAIPAECPLRTALPPFPGKAWPLPPARGRALRARLPPHASSTAARLADVRRRVGLVRFAREAPAPPALLSRPNLKSPPPLPDKPSAPARAGRQAGFPRCDHAILLPEPESLLARAFDRVPPVRGAVAILDGFEHRRCTSRPARWRA